MKKKAALLLMACALIGMTACGNEKTAASSPNTAPSTVVSTETTGSATSMEAGSAEEKENGAGVLNPLPVTINMDNLSDHTFPAGFEAKDIYRDGDKLVIRLHVYDYDLYDLVDVSQLKVGDYITLCGESIEVKSLERDTYGFIRINGGFENDGHTLMTNESGVYFAVRENEAKAFNDLGEVVLPVAQNFVFTDDADLENRGKEYKAEDLIAQVSGSGVTFGPNATTITVDSNGEIIEMHHAFVP